MSNTQEGAENPTPPNPSDQPLKTRVISAGLWLLGARVFQQAVLLLRPLVLARILAPDDFGVMGIALMTRLLLNQISVGAGLRDALIRRDDLTRRHFATVWTFEAGRLILLGGILVAAAPLVADFFNSPRATPIIRVAGFEVMLIALTSIGMVIVRKELNFRKEFYYNLVPTVVGTGVTIGLALVLRNVWSLALGQLTQSILMVTMSYILAPYFVRPTWDLAKLKDLAGFAVWSSVSSILSVVISQVDRLFVGRIMGPASLGIYVIAGRITNLMSIEVANAVHRVGFPAFSKVQRDQEALREAFIQLLATTLFLLGPLALFIAIWAPELVEVLLGTKWLDAVPAMRTLAGSAVLFALAQIFSTIHRSMGRALIAATADGIKLAVMLAVAYPLISSQGLTGAGLTVASGSSVSLSYLIWKSRDTLPTGPKFLIGNLTIAILLSTGLLTSFALKSVDTFNVYERFIYGSLAFGIGYVLISLILFKLFNVGPAAFFIAIRNRKFSK